jgi:hypothetical protein
MTNAEWAARADHTSVVDAAAAIYVIGGAGDTGYQDVWVNRGARPDSVEGGRGALVGYYRGSRWSTRGVLKGILHGFSMGYSRGTPREYSVSLGILLVFSGYVRLLGSADRALRGIYSSTYMIYCI